MNRLHLYKIKSSPLKSINQTQITDPSEGGFYLELILNAYP